MEELNYNLLSKNVPNILEQDWGVKFNNSNEKEIAIKIFEWKYGPQDIYADMSIESWQKEEVIKFNKGYCQSKISFSLDKEKVSVIKIMTSIIFFMIGDKNKPETYIGSGLALTEIFRDAMNVHMLKDGLQRCIFMKMIELSKNNPHIPIMYSDIKSYFKDLDGCMHTYTFNCKYYIQSEGCLAKEEDVRKTIACLIEKRVIRCDGDNVYYII